MKYLSELWSLANAECPVTMSGTWYKIEAQSIQFVRVSESHMEGVWTQQQQMVWQAQQQQQCL